MSDKVASEVMVDPIFQGRSSWSRPAVDYAILAASYEARLRTALLKSARVFERAGMFNSSALLERAAEAIEILHDEEDDDAEA